MRWRLAEALHSNRSHPPDFHSLVHGAEQARTFTTPVPVLISTSAASRSTRITNFLSLGQGVSVTRRGSGVLN